MKKNLAVLALLSLLVGIVGFAQEKKEEPKGPLTGAWQCVSKIPDRPDGDFQLDLEQKGEEVTGTGSNTQGSAPLKGTFKEGKFKLSIDAGNVTYEIEGSLDQDKISGTLEVPQAAVKGTFEGTRKKA